MKISFILPGLIKIPIGGVKVVYRYAEELAKRDHKVSIISPRREGRRPLDIIKAGAVKLRDRWHGVGDQPYYQTPPGVDHHIIPEPDPEFVPNGDVVIATGWQSASWVNALPKSKGSKFYFIQNYEIYQGNKNIIKQTWKLPLKKIVIAQWLKDLAEEMGETASGPIPNAVDPGEFFITNPIEDRLPLISMLYHRLSIKGSRDGITVLQKIKNIHPNLKAVIFSSRRPSITVPDWISLEIRPDIERLKGIYNSSAIFLHPSHQEGWPLPPAEAMACGAVIVAAGNEGIKEFVIHDKTGFLSPIGEIETLTQNVLTLLEKPEKRIKIAKAGQEAIGKYSWAKSTEQFETVLMDIE